MVILVTALIGVLIVSLAVLLAIAGLSVVQRLVPLSLRQSHNAATGTIYAAIYVMFGVSVGFSLFILWQQYDTAQKTAEGEAATVEEIYRLAGSFPEPERGRVQELAISYARVVVDEEWQMMGEGRTSPHAAERADELREGIQDFKPHTEDGRALRAAGLTQLDDLDQRRALRLLEVREGLPPIVWVVLVVGGVITVSFTFLFGLETPWIHMLAVAALTVVVALLIYTISILDYPFDNGLQVKPDAFVLALDRME